MITRTRRRLVLPLIAVFLIGALIGSLIMGWLYPRVNSSAIDNAAKEVVITAAVTEQPVREVYSLSAQVSAPTIVEVRPLEFSGSAARQVVSGRVHAVGDVIRYADLLGEVSDRPVFAVPTSVPLYRDLVQGSEGNDVAGIQQMLTSVGLYAGSVDGKLGASTLKALTQMYSRAGYALPELGSGMRSFPLSEAALVPGDGLVVTEVAGLGVEITAVSGADEAAAGGTSLVRLQTKPAVITARADLLQVDAFVAGATVSVQIGSNTPFDSTVVSVSEFTEAEFSLPAGYDITISVPAEFDVSTAMPEPVIVTEKTNVPVGTAVPLTAIRRDVYGESFVLVPPPESSGQTTIAPARVDVTVIGQAAGYAIIEENPNLTIGASVVVSGG